MLPWQPIFGLKLALCELQRLHDRLWRSVLVVACDRVSDSERVLCFGGVIFYFLKFFSVHRFVDVPGPIFAKLCHTTRYVLK